MIGGGTAVRLRTLAALGGALLVLVGSLLFSLLFLRSTSHWWFEDDPAQYAYVSGISNPLRFFADPALVRNFGTRASLVPMQLLSSWLDVRLFGLSPAMAYWHGVAALAVTALLLYAVLLRWTGDRRVSDSASLLWLLLPSTIAVHSFLSARHYLEGLGWSLAACLFARALADPARRAGTDWLWAGLLATTVAAMLSKETYAVALPAYLALDALTRRQRSVAIAMAGLVVAYAAYRTWLVGSGGHYPGSRPSMGEIPAFLKAVTYTLTSNPGGWVFYGFLAAGCAVLLRPRRAASSREVSLIALLLALSVAAILPTASAILATYRTPGTWYRAPFLVHTVALLGAAVLLSRHTPPWIRATAALYFAAALVPGALSARVWWTERLERSRAEGQFYLANPDKLVYSEEGLLVPSWSRSALRGREPAFRQQGFRSGGATTSDARAIPDHLALSQRAIRGGCRSLRRHPQP